MSWKLRITGATARLLATLLVLLCAAPGAYAEEVFSVTQYGYDANLRLQCTAVRMNKLSFAPGGPAMPSDACVLGTEGNEGPDRITRIVHDTAGQVREVWQAYWIAGAQRRYAAYTYSANGRKITETDANGNLTTLEYDGFDRLKKLRYPSTTIGAGTSSSSDYEEYAYDNNGNKTWHRTRDNRALNFQYDNLNRQITKFASDSSIRSVHTIYNLLGSAVYRRFDSVSGPGVTYTYDILGRVLATTDLNGRTIGYGYNAAGARTRMSFPDGNYVDYALDNANRIKSFGWNASSGVFAQGFNSLGQLTSETRGGGSVSYGYDGMGRLNAKTNTFNATASNITWTFVYNPASQLATTTTSSDLYDYEELSSITEPAQAHDGLNRVSTLVGATGACPAGGYDARGNLICDGTGRKYTYDIENRLLTGNIAGNGLTLTYDPEGRLSSYSWNGGAVSFLYDGVNLIGEYNSSNQMLRRYVHGPGTDNPVVWYEGSGNSARRYFYTNQQGSVITTADASGNRGDIYAYGPYGEPKDQAGFTYWPSIGTGATSVSRFGYTGQMFLADARLYYYKARIYDPQMGRFLQTDPIGSKDDLNLYAYVAGDPVNGTDPSGTCIWDACIVEAATVATVGAIAVHTTCVATGCYDAMAEGIIAGGRAIGNGFKATGDAIGRLLNEAKKPPNPEGKKGSQEHQDKIKDRIKELEGDDWSHEAGGDKPEEAVPTPGGEKKTRYPDITMGKPDGSKHRENVGRENKNGSPVSRERRARQDIENATGQCSFSGYCKK